MTSTVYYHLYVESKKCVCKKKSVCVCVCVCVCVKVAQSCSFICNLMDYTVHGILQARILAWVAFPFPEDLPNPAIKLRTHAWQVDSLPDKSQRKQYAQKGS